MRLHLASLLLAGAAVAAAPALAAPAIEAHDVTVRLVPAESALDAEDRMLVRRDGGGTLRFELNAGLEIASATVDGRPAAPEKADRADAWSQAWHLAVPAGTSERAEVIVSYRGSIADPVRVGEESPPTPAHGRIGPRGAYLSAAARWVPADGNLARFTVRTRPVAGWELVTQGTRTAPATADAPDAPTVWRGKFDAEGVALAAGPWKVLRKRFGDVEVGAYVSEASAAGAGELLDRVGAGLRSCGERLPPYAYDRFDLVECPEGVSPPDPSGRGTPEFVVVGADVLRAARAERPAPGAFPTGWLGRAIVHGWWGDLVLADPATGDWCEALTTACADEREDATSGPAAAAERRRTASLRFALRVDAARDVPLRKLSGIPGAADDGAAAAILRDKGAMFFHALRREIGDGAFWDTLRRVALERRGRRVGWEDWRAEFERSAKRGLDDFFRQGLDRAGAPLLELAQTRTRADGGRFRVTGVLRQVLAPGEAPWRISVPLVVEHLEGTEETILDVSGAETPFALTSPSIPLRVLADPQHHVFRTLAREETPACLAATLARPRVVIVHPDGDEVLARAARAAARDGNAVVVAASEAPAGLQPGTSYVLFGDAARSPLLARVLDRLPRHVPPPAARREATIVLASSRSPADAAEFVTTVVGAPEALAARPLLALSFPYDGRVVLDGQAPADRTASAVASRTVRLLLPDLKSATSPERAQRTVAALSTPAMKGRAAGSAEEAKARAYVMDELRLCGIEPEERPFTFAVKRLDPGRPVLTRTGGAAVEGVVPLVASPATPEGGVSIVGSVDGDDADLAGRALVVDLGAGAEKPLAFLREVAKLAVARRAAALFVRMPETVPPSLAELFAFPEALHADVLARLAQQRERGGDGDPLRHAARVAARIGSDVEFPLPVVTVPHGYAPAKDEFLRLDVQFGRAEIRSANVVGRLRARGARRAGTVVLGARLDHWGDGFPGAGSGASGVAALVEAVNVLAAQDDLLARDVLLCFFGAEEWGLRGSRAFTAELAERHDIVAMAHAGSVGSRDADGVSIPGAALHPRLALAVGTSIQQAALDVGPELDAPAFADGSAAWTFHLRGVPAVDLWSGDARGRSPRDDTADGVDAAKVARVGRVLALAALAVSGGW